MKAEYPLFPELSEKAQSEAQEVMDMFKEKMEKLCKETLGILYCDCVSYIESDSWSNFRNELMDGFRNYNNKKIQGEFDFAIIRKEILKNHYEQIVHDLNNDLVKENIKLKNDIKRLEKVLLI